MNEFLGLLRSEWIKLRSVPRWLVALGAAVGLTVLVALLTAAGAGGSISGDGGGSGAEGGKPPRGFQDGGTFVYKELPGDGSLVAKVAAQENTGPWAKAGLMIRAGEEPGAKHAAVMRTPGHGVQMMTDFKNKAAGTGDWLKIDRVGSTVTGYASADGTSWKKLASYELGGTVHVGMFVATPVQTKVVRQFGGESISSEPTVAEAAFERISQEPAGPDPSGWTVRDSLEGPAAPDLNPFTWTGGRATLVGAMDIGPDPYSEDFTRTALNGILIGLIAIVGVMVLFVTSEYRRGMALTTFIVTPRRGRVLAARTLLLAGIGFVLGIVAAVVSLLGTAPLLRESQRSDVALSDPLVLRAVLCTGLLVALVTVFSVAMATLLRHTAAAVTIVLMALLVPQIVQTGLPLSAAAWVGRLTPAAGFEAQQTLRQYDTPIGPWAGLAVLALYAAVTLALAARALAGRDA